MKQLKAGGDFSEIAKQESLDHATKDSGGMLLNWIIAGNPVPAFDRDQNVYVKLFELEVNAPPVVIKDSKGFHIVQTVDKKAPVQKNFDEVKEQVAFEYRQEKADKLSQELLTKLLKTKDVQIFSSKFKRADRLEKSDTGAPVPDTEETSKNQEAGNP